MPDVENAAVEADVGVGADVAVREGEGGGKRAPAVVAGVNGFRWGWSGAREAC